MNYEKIEKYNIRYFHAFGCSCYILNTKDQIRKFDYKISNSIFLSYSLNLKH